MTVLGLPVHEYKCLPTFSSFFIILRIFIFISENSWLQCRVSWSLISFIGVSQFSACRSYTCESSVRVIPTFFVRGSYYKWYCIFYFVFQLSIDSTQEQDSFFACCPCSVTYHTNLLVLATSFFLFLFLYIPWDYLCRKLHFLFFFFDLLHWLRFPVLFSIQMVRVSIPDLLPSSFIAEIIQ